MSVASEKKAISIGVLAVLVATTVCAKHLWQRGSCVEIFPNGSEKILYGKACDLLLSVYATSEENLGLNSSLQRHLEVSPMPSAHPRNAPEHPSKLLIATSTPPQRRPRTFGTRAYRPKRNVKATIARTSKRTLLAKNFTSGTDARVKTVVLRRQERLKWALRKYGYGDNEG
jgi:hypothetical protein